MSKQIEAINVDDSNTNYKSRRNRLQAGSTTSLDSGMWLSNHTSNSSIAETDANFESSSGTSDIPIITVDKADNDVLVKTASSEVSAVAPDVQTDLQTLDVHTRRWSNASTLSSLSDYHTAPNSPSLTRSTSLDSISSNNSANSPAPCQSDREFYMSQTVATSIEKNDDKSLCVAVAMPSRPVEVELSFTKHCLTITSKNQIAQNTISALRLTDGLPCKLTVKISNKLTSLQITQVPLVSKATKTMEKRIKEIVTGNLADFRDHTNLDALSAHLTSAELLSMCDFEQLQATPTTRGRMNHFYILILPKKGKCAYEKFFDCLKSETSHRGHLYLVSLINEQL